jgi:hypothetical protein
VPCLMVDKATNLILFPVLLALCFEFCYSVTNQRESFIFPDLMVKNNEVPIES